MIGAIDDKFVVMGQGDEIQLGFQPLPDPPASITRELVFSAYGYYKDGKTDLPLTVDPLPFAAMSNYPYPASESYPTDQGHTDYLQQYNTRVDGIQSAPAVVANPPGDAGTISGIGVITGTYPIEGQAHHSLNTNYLAVNLSYTTTDTSSVGGCETCHAVHGNGGVVPAALWSTEDRLCLNCHSTTDSSANGINIAERFSTLTDNRTHHDVSPAAQVQSGAKVTCSNCHNPHQDNELNRYDDPDAISKAMNPVSDYADASGNMYVMMAAQHDGHAPVISNYGYNLGKRLFGADDHLDDERECDQLGGLRPDHGIRTRLGGIEHVRLVARRDPDVARERPDVSLPYPHSGRARQRVRES